MRKIWRGMVGRRAGVLVWWEGAISLAGGGGDFCLGLEGCVWAREVLVAGYGLVLGAERIEVGWS